MNTSSVFSKNLYAYAILGKRIIVNSGGTSSTKTYSIIQLLILIALSSAVPLIISIVSESVPHLKRGTIRDFQNILAENYDANRYNLTDRIYVFPNGSILEFFSADDPARLRGGRRDILFINECNNLSKNAFDELDVRTRKCTFLDFNPVSEFWALDPVLINRPDVEFIRSTYRDALHVLAPETVAAIESRRSDPNWWRIYGEGLVGCIEGLVHSTFTTVDALPPHDSCIYGLDFGFSQDPTCLTRNVFVGKNIYSDCLIYETGLTNDKIVARFQSLGLRPGYDEIYADSADPKSIAEIREAGYNVKPVVKGADSLITGIQKVNQYTQHWTKTSVDAIKEQRNYRYIEDRDGKLTNKPTDAWNHAMDSRRYAVMSKLRQQTKFLKIAV
jgi:phage terminase large subunit